MIVAVGGIPTDYGKDTVQTTNSTNTRFSATEWASWRRKPKWYVCLNNFDLIYLRRFIVCKNQEKDYSLLRSFDLEAAKDGAPILFGGHYEAVSFVGRAHSGKTNIIEYSGMNNGIVDRVRYAEDEWLRMAPLCWVEGKPVYKGDKLWNKFAPAFVYIADQVEGDVLRSNGLTTGNREEVINLTWTPPKVKREGWMNCYLEGEKCVYPTEEIANKMAGTTRTSCVRIEWEE